MTEQPRPATRPSPDLAILETRVYRGANVWSYDKAIHLVVDLGSLEDFPTNTLPGFTDEILQMLPGLREHSCSRGRRGGFVERLNEGTWLGHVAEHVALALQQVVGHDIRRGKTRQVKGARGRYNIVYGYVDEQVGLAAARLAVRLVNHLVEEEGSRFGIACLGSRLLTGATTWERARELRDRDGVRLPDALAAEDLHGPEPGRDLLARVGCFVELHVEQGRDLVHRDAPIGVASAIWPHGRYRFDFAGEANHAGTTRMEDRRDPMLSYAMTALAANKQARTRGQRATFGRVEVRPNGTNAVPSHVTAWLDARAESDRDLDALLADVSRQAQERAERDGTSLTVTAESVSGEVRFDPDLAAQIAALGDWPVIPTMAGHDAGVLSAAGIPTAMLFVRNPTGVSHSPAEQAETADCLAGVGALADTLAALAGGDR